MNKLTDDGRYLMAIWATWSVASHDAPGSTVDSIERAAHQARTATNKQGRARWKGGPGKVVPPMPKDSRQSAGSRPPNGIHYGADYGLLVDRLLMDLEAEGMRITVAVLKRTALRKTSVAALAAESGLNRTAWRKYRDDGYTYIAGWFRGVRKELSQ